MLLVHLKNKKQGQGGSGESTAGESDLATSLWGMLYADDAEVVLQSSEAEKDDERDRGRVRGVWHHRIGGQDWIMCLLTKGMLKATALFSVEAAVQVYSQTIELVYFGGNNHNAHLSTSSRPAETQHMVQLPEVHSRTVVSHIQRVGCQPEKTTKYTRWPVPRVVC